MGEEAHSLGEENKIEPEVAQRENER